MALFKRKINKNATTQPKFVVDRNGTPFTNTVGIDGTAFACIDRIASEFAMLNYGVYKVSDKQKVRKHPIYDLIKEPNLDDRHFNFFYQSAKDYFNGGCFWLIRRFEGEVVSLYRLNPEQVTIVRNQNTNRREFLYRGYTFTQKDVAYIPSRYDYNATSGSRSIMDACPSVFDTSKNIEGYTQATFKNGIHGKRLVIDISGLVQEPTDEQLMELKNNVQAEYSGVENSSRPLLKKKGINYDEIGSSFDNQSAELSKNRELQKQSMSTIFAVAQSILEGKNPTEMDFAIFCKFAIQPMATQFQEVINSLLDEDKYYFEFDYNGVMKVSLTQRIDAYTKQISSGILSLDEVRAKENLPPIDAGDTNFMPANMMPWNSEIKDAYMSKQKQIAKEGEEQITDPTDPNTQHIPQGDDKQ